MSCNPFHSSTVTLGFARSRETDGEAGAVSDALWERLVGPVTDTRQPQELFGDETLEQALRQLTLYDHDGLPVISHDGQQLARLDHPPGTSFKRSLTACALRIRDRARRRRSRIRRPRPGTFSPHAQLAARAATRSSSSPSAPGRPRSAHELASSPGPPGRSRSQPLADERSFHCATTASSASDSGSSSSHRHRIAPRTQSVSQDEHRPLPRDD